MENQNQDPKAQLIQKLKESNNVLVTVSRDPSVDQLSAAIGLTLLLNKLDKHATAVFSGNVPSTLEFLQPEETIERNTDSLRDFIISLDKSKADKLRYKVEDKMVKIFITPYRTSITQEDLIFSQGDFNVDVVVALGVHQKEELDEAIISHGRILHDATVVSVNTTPNGQFGSVNWVDGKTSSLSEMIVPVCEALKADALDAQMATAFLTGIVAETQRFSNEKTSSDTMNISAKLMAAGANQQLVATKLEQPEPEQTIPPPDTNESPAVPVDAASSDGSLNIDHAAEEIEAQTELSASMPPEIMEQAQTIPEQPRNESTDLPEVQPDHQVEPDMSQELPPELTEDENQRPSRFVMEPPRHGGTLTASAKPEDMDPSTDPLTVPQPDQPLLSHDNDDNSKDDDVRIEKPSKQHKMLAERPEESQEDDDLPEDEAFDPFMLDHKQPSSGDNKEPDQEKGEKPTETQSQQSEIIQPSDPPIQDNQTLNSLEKAVDSPHQEDKPGDEPARENSEVPDATAALAAAHEAFDALATGSAASEKPADFNTASPQNTDQAAPATAETSSEEPAEPIPDTPVNVSIDPTTGTLSYPTNLVPPSQGLPTDPTATGVEDPTAAPAVPPPIPMPPFIPAAEPGNNETLPDSKQQ